MVLNKLRLKDSCDLKISYRRDPNACGMSSVRTYYTRANVIRQQTNRLKV